MTEQKAYIKSESFTDLSFLFQKKNSLIKAMQQKKLMHSNE